MSNTAISTLNAVIKANPEGFLSAMELSIGKLLDFSDEVNTVSQAVNHFADGFVTELLAVTAALGVAGYEASNFEDKVTDVYTLVDETETSISDLSNGILKAAGNLKELPTDVAVAEYQTISGGVNDFAESLLFTETAGKLAKGGIGKADDATKMLTKSMEAFGYTEKDAVFISDQLITTVKEGTTTISEMAASYGKVASSASKAGIGMNELNAATAVMSKEISTSEAHTYLRAVISGIVKPTGDAVKMAKQLGLEFNYQALQAKGLTGFLKDLDDKVGGNSEIMNKLFGSVEAANGALILSGEKLKEYNRILNEINNSSGATEKAFQKQIQQTKSFWVNTRLLVTEIGTKLLPVINVILTPINKLFDAWQNGNPILKDTIMYVGLLVAALAPFRYIILLLSLAGGKIIGLLPLLMNGLAWLLPWILKAIPLLLRLLGLTNPIGWAIVAIIGVIQLLRHNVFGITDVIWEVITAINEALEEIARAFVPLDEIRAWAKEFYESIGPETKLIIQAISNVLKNNLSKELSKFKILVKAITSGIINSINYLKERFLNFVSSVKQNGPILKIILNSIFLGLPGLIESTTKMLAAFVEKLKEYKDLAWEILSILQFSPGFSGIYQGAKLFGEVAEEYKKLKAEIEKDQGKLTSGQKDLNNEIDGTNSRLKKNSKYWQNWAKEILAGIGNKSKRFSELMAQQPNYGGALSGGVSSANPSGLYGNPDKGAPLIIVIDGHEYVFPNAAKNLTTFERRQFQQMAEELNKRRKNNKPPRPMGGQ